MVRGVRGEVWVRGCVRNFIVGGERDGEKEGD